MESNAASFSLFARGYDVGGPRVALSLECPFYDASVLEIGIDASKNVYASAVAADQVARSGRGVGFDDWTHMAAVWNGPDSTFSLFMDGSHIASVVLNKPDEMSFVKSAEEWRLVLGRGKRAGKQRDGWDGEVSYTNFRLSWPRPGLRSLNWV